MVVNHDTNHLIGESYEADITQKEYCRNGERQCCEKYHKRKRANKETNLRRHRLIDTGTLQRYIWVN